MKKKLISMTLIFAAMVLPTSVPESQGGKISSYNTPWSLSCGANGVSGTITLYTKAKSVAVTTDCAPSLAISTVTGTINTVWVPTNWTWSAPGCFTSIGSPLPAVSGKIDTTKSYNCNSSSGPLISTGNVGAGKPVGVQ